MKKLFAIGIVLCISIVLATYDVTAQEKDEPTTSPKTKQEDIKSKVDQLKEKVASTVAQLNLVTKRGLVGEVTKLEKNQITIESRGETKIIDVDELTKYFKIGKDVKRNNAKFSDLDVNDTIVAIGLFNKESRRLLARIILIKEIPIHIEGVVREVDIKGGTITIEDKKRGKTFIIDIEKTTTIRNYTKAEGLVKSGISKIEIGQRARVRGIRNEKEEDRLSATRIILFPGKTNGIMNSTPSASPTEKPSPTATPGPTKKPSKATPTPTPSEEITP